MIGFAALRWQPHDRSAEDRAMHVGDALRQRSWQVLVEQPGWRILGDPATNLALPLGGDTSAVVIGYLFDRPASQQPHSSERPLAGDAGAFARLCARLVANHWGAYAALDPSTGPDDVSVFRDPMGFVDCVTWRSGGLRIVTSRGSEIMPAARPEGLAINWDRLGQITRCPGAAGDDLPLRGVTSLAPGTLLCASGGSARTLWTPASLALSSSQSDMPGDPVALIDACTAAWSDRLGPGIAELSGGLDSAIVAASLARCEPARATRWLHFHAAQAPSDERPFARATAQHLGLQLEEVTRPETGIDLARLETIPLGLRPSVGSLSLFHDEALAALARGAGTTILYTGQGGDALFYQLANPALGEDIWRSAWPLGRKLRATENLARWTGMSVWAIAAATLRARFGGAPPDPHFPLDLVSSAIPRPSRPLLWMEGIEALPPSRQVTVLHLAAIRAIMAPSWSSEAMTVVHPLLSQPVVEHFLSRSPLELTEARRDRALIRSAYAGRLPAMVLERRGKGCVTAYYGRMIVRSLPFLRDYLLGGLLAANGVLARDTVEAILDEDVLIQTNAYAEIFCALFAERWARGWAAIIAAS